MKSTWKRILSLILVAAMVLSFGATGYAAGADEDIVLAEPETEPAAEQQTEPTTDAKTLEMEDLDPAKLGVHKLGEDTQEDEISIFDTEEALAGAEFDPNETVRVSIFLDGSATLDLGYSMRGIGTNSSAIAYRSSLRAQQDALTAQIESATGHALDVRWNMTLATNAISANVHARDIALIEEMPGVRAVVRENYCLPPVDEPADPNTANTSENMVGAQAAWDAGYSGAGSRVAIIDTGIDTTHQSFAAEPFTYSIGRLGATSELMTQAQVQALASQLNSKTGNYVSAKIPYGYNYVDGNTTINHINDTQGEHGSHVAGIAAANRYIGSAHSDAVSTVGAVGMAPDAQLFIMKVFGSKGGAYDSDYMVAIEDAIVLDCDVVNLSLGSGSQGWTFDDTYQDILNNLTDKSHNEGMVVSISAGNAYDFAKLTNAGNLYKDDVYYHTGGSPGTFVNSLCVAAAQNTLTKGMPLIFNGNQTVFYAESTEDEDGNAYGNAKMSSIAGTYSYVYIDAVGEAADYSAVNSAVSLNGKIVIVNRGGISFTEKGNNAKSYSPKGLVVANNTDGVIHMALTDFEGTFPMVSITLKDANLIKEASTSATAGGVTYYTGSVQVTNVEQQTIDDRTEATITDFSSWGVPGSLIMKPEITAPGGDIYSVAGTNKTSSGGTAGGSDQYEYMSGTSMAAPHITGLSAVVAEYLREKPVADRNSALSDAYSTRAIIQSLLMSTATPMQPGGEYLPVLQQGAGLAEVSKAVSAPSVLMITDEGKTLTVRTGANADGKVKAEFGDDPEREGVYSFGFTLYNLSDKDLSYTLSTDLFTQKISGDFLTRGTANLPAGGVTYIWNGETPEQSTEHDVNMDGTTDEADVQAILDYVSGASEAEIDEIAADMDGDEIVTSYDAHLLLNWEPEGGTPTGDYVLAAHGTAEVVVSINLTAAQKDFLDAKYPNGAYLEGFTYVTCKDATREGESLAHEHSIPLLGFYGSWTDPSMFDNMSHVDELYGAERLPYSGTSDTNYLMVNYSGSNLKFSGNPYMVEKEFPADRLALSTNTNLIRISYNLIRSAGTTGYAVTKLDDEGNVTDILSSSVTGNLVTGQWYSSSAGWQNTGTKLYSINKTVGSYGLAEGDRFRLGFYAVPEYNGMMINDSYNAAGAGALNLSGFNDLLESNALGMGALVGYDFVVDNTEPTISNASLSGNTLSVSASDNENLAYVAVLSLDGTVKYAEAAPGDKTYTISFDASDAIANANGYVAVFAGDYAGNEAAVAVKVNDNTYEEKTVYVLSSTLTAGNDYLIVNRNAAGSGVALGHSGTTVATNAVTVKAGNSDTNNQPYIESADVADTSVWTAASGITLKNGNYYLRRNNSTLQISTTNSNNTWSYSNSRLSNGNYYLRYYNSTFSLNTATNSVYLFVKTVIRTEIDPYSPTNITVTPESLDLYKGNTADLTAKVNPLTATDRSVSWSSSNTSVATVDDTGHVTAKAAGSATITATANGNSALSASCAVTVTSVNKTLNGIVWDVEGDVYFSSFNANNLPTWSKLHNDDKAIPLHSALYQSSKLYAATLDASTATSTLYTVNTSSYALTEVDAMAYFASDMAPGPTSYASNYGIMVQPYGPYLLVATVTDPSGGIYGASDDLTTTIGDDVYVVAVAAKSLNRTSADYYFLDESGTVWQISLSGTSFGTPTKVLETGLSASLLYQTLYYDGTYLYWGRYADNAAELIIMNPSNGAVYHAGDFGDGVWPAVGFYVSGSVAPAAVEDEPDGSVEEELSFAPALDEAVTEEINGRILSEASRLALSVTTEEDEAPDDLELVDVSEADTDLVLEEPENDDIVIEADGALTAIRGTVAVKAAGESETNDGKVTITLTEDTASTNGYFTVNYDPDVLTPDEEGMQSSLSYHSIYVDDKGVISFTYANKTALPAGTVLAEIRFKAVCEDTTVSVGTVERNNDVELAEEEEVPVEGTGHNWDEPAWRWADDYSRATASFICLNNGEHTHIEEADITTEIVEAGCETDGTTTYTATVELDGETYTDTKTVTTEATGHVWGNPVWNWAEDLESATVTFTCTNDPNHSFTADADIKSVIDPEPDCENEGVKTISALYTIGNLPTFTDQKTVTIPALGHDWGEITYTWADDNSTVTATRTCQRDASHVETETVNTVESTTGATCEADGVRTWTATFTNSAFETQTRTESIPATGHDWDAPTYVWAADNSSVTATRVCKNDASHKETETVTPTYQVITEPTTTSNGLGRYTATFTNPAFETQTKDVVIDKLPSGDGYTITIVDYTKYTAYTVINEEDLFKGEVTFTVETIGSTEPGGVRADQAVLVAVKNTDDEDETYQVVTCVTEGGVHSFTITVNANTTVALALKGDANLDGELEGKDSTMVKRAALHTYDFPNIVARLGCDVDGNGDVEGKDGTMIARAVLNTYTITWNRVAG